MLINASQLATTHQAAKIEVNKSVASQQAQSIAPEAIENSAAINPQQTLVDVYHEDVATLQSRLGAHVEYESQTGGQRGAVAEYLINQHAAKRDEIQQMVGIDTYA